MIACVDVDYRDPVAVAACLLFRHWTDEHVIGEAVEHIPQVEPYQPGQFYKRELPCLLTVLGKLPQMPETVVIDGYVWLRDEQTPGLGGHLFAALGKAIPVIGVAKTCFLSARAARPVLRGGSLKPLFVTAAGVDVETAAQSIRSMHGPHRLPTIIKRVDQLCRTTGKDLSII